MNIRNRGFTLIELLIVIAVLGILAVAVLAAINPIEQINRSRDTGNRSDSEQLVSAIDRFYASKGYNPWTDGAASVNPELGWTNIKLAVGETVANKTFGVDAVPMLDNLSAQTGELKPSFMTRITAAGYNYLFIYNQGGQSDTTYVCFLPKSDNFLDEAETRCIDAGGAGLPDDLLPIGGTICSGWGLAGVLRVVYSCLP